MLFAACWGRETSRVMKSQGPGVLSGECYKTLALCWWCRSDLTEDMLTHYMLYLPFIRGHRRTYSRVISIIFICCRIYWVLIYRIHPVTQKYPSTEYLVFWGLLFSLTGISGQKWTMSSPQWSRKCSTIRIIYSECPVFMSSESHSKGFFLNSPLCTGIQNDIQGDMHCGGGWAVGFSQVECNVMHTMWFFFFVSCTLKYPAHVGSWDIKYTAALVKQDLSEKEH